MNEFMVSDPSDSTSPELALEAAGMGIWEFDIERGELRFDGPTVDLLERHDLLRPVFLAEAATGLA